jgi:hypothetical protein
MQEVLLLCSTIPQWRFPAIDPCGRIKKLHHKEAQMIIGYFGLMVTLLEKKDTSPRSK